MHGSAAKLRALCSEYNIPMEDAPLRADHLPFCTSGKRRGRFGSESGLTDYLQYRAEHPQLSPRGVGGEDGRTGEVVKGDACQVQESL